MTEIYKRGSWLVVEHYMLSVACQHLLGEGKGK